MNKKIAICPGCHTKTKCEGESGQKVSVECPNCGRTGSIVFKSELKELDFYPLNEPYAYAKILKNMDTLEKHYKVIEPYLSEEEQKTLNFIWETLLKTFNLRLDELDSHKIENYLTDQVEQVLNNYEIDIDELLKKKILYYIKRESLGYGKIDPLMKDPHIEDISCDGSGVPIFLYHRKYGSVRSNVEFKDEDELSYFVVRLAQKCSKHISIAEPMLDATMPDGSRIQMTLSSEVTTKGSTFTIRKFRADPFTPPDLIVLNTVNSEILAYFWLAVENRVNAIIAGGTASGKTTILNALSLFIPREAKIVSIEETREINLPHPNWIPGVSRSGFGEIVADKMVGEIDMYDLMKAALRQRPEYILVGEIRGREAYVLFQAMATGHATYSTVHADSAKSLIHRLEGKPINIPRIMIQSLDIVSIHITTRVKGKRVRRCKQVIEIIDIDPSTKEILTNEVFRWDPIEDRFIYTGKSYVLEGIRARWDITKEEITKEIRQRAEILEWMKDNDIRTYREVAKAISRYADNSKDFLKRMKHPGKKKKKEEYEEEKKVEKKKEKPIAQLKEKEEEKEKKEIPEESIEEKEVKEPAEDIDYILDQEEKIKPFKDMESIDIDIAILLYDNGYTDVKKLENVSIRDLTKIKGINRKTAKKILKEIEQKTEWESLEIQEEIKEKTKEKKEISFIEEEPIGELAETIDEKKEEVPEAEPSITEVPEEEKIIEGPSEVKEDIIEQEVKIEAFKDMESVDDETAILLYDNGYTNTDSLKYATLKNLTKIKGLKRKKAKIIKNEIDKKIVEAATVKPITMGETVEDELTEDQLQKEEKDEDFEKEEDLPSPVELSTKYSEGSPVKEEEKSEPEVDLNIKIEAFKDIESVDDETAILLYDNGFTNIDSIKNSTLKDLTQIKEIKKKKLKIIKKEVDKKQIKKSDKQNKVEEDPADSDTDKENKSKNFEVIKSIDDKTIIQLKENEFITFGDLKNAIAKDLVKNEEIKIKNAKKIIKELNSNTDEKLTESSDEGGKKDATK